MLIGLSGPRFAGKDTIANHLVNKHGYKKYAFADKIRRSLEYIFCLPKKWNWDINKEKPNCEYLQGFSPREMMQWYGTEGFPFIINSTLNNFVIYNLYLILFGCSKEIAQETFDYDFFALEKCMLNGGFRNKISKTFWVDHVFDYMKMPSFIDNIVISDVRFPEDIEFIKNNGKLIYIDRTNTNAIETSHESEQYLKLAKSKADCIIHNNNTNTPIHLKTTIDHILPILK